MALLHARLVAALAKRRRVVQRLRHKKAGDNTGGFIILLRTRLNRDRRLDVRVCLVALQFKIGEVKRKDILNSRVQFHHR